MARHIQAAGGVLWRTAGAEIQVALVHRPKYDDWSLPKGKAQAGEHTVTTAEREVGEETGYVVEFGDRLPTVSYGLRGGDIKVVDYWSMRCAGGEFTANDEVDAITWLTVPDALERASNDDARTTIAAFAAQPRTTSTVLLVRHARAGKKATWRHDDRLRPLDHHGRIQAELLRRALSAWRPRRIAAADRARCEQTVEPLGAFLGLPVDSEPTLTEEFYASSPSTTYSRFRDYTQLPGTTVLCSQGGVIPDLIAQVAVADSVGIGDPESRKGSAWALGFTAGMLVCADYYPNFRAGDRA